MARRRRSLVPGRWQPGLHDGHKALIRAVLAGGSLPVIAVRDTAVSADNPLTALERVDLIRKEFGDRVEVFVIPDFDEIINGRTPGWETREVVLDEQTRKISGTAIRGRKRPVIWLTANSGGGKSTLAGWLRRRPELAPAVVLDGDEMRASVSEGAGFSPEDRLAHNKRVARLADVLSYQATVLVAVIAPTEEVRRVVTEVCDPVWVYLDRETPWDGSAERPYERPEDPDLVISGTTAEMGRQVLAYLDNLDGE